MYGMVLSHVVSKLNLVMTMLKFEKLCTHSNRLCDRLPNKVAFGMTITNQAGLTGEYLSGG